MSIKEIKLNPIWFDENNKEEKNKIKNKNRRNAILSPLIKRHELKLSTKSNNKKSKSFKKLFINNSNDGYFLNKNIFINDSIPYEQEKLIKRIENARNKRKWMNLKGFFTSANKQTFNSLISPNLKIHKIKISNNNEKKCKKLSLINMSSDWVNSSKIKVKNNLLKIFSVFLGFFI